MPDAVSSRAMKLLMIGGGICGLGTALMLARDGHDVTVLERDDDGLPESAAAAWEAWGRKGVAQFRQPHNLMPGLRLLLDAELPDINDALVRAGATKFNFVNPLPPFYTDRAPRPIDENLWCYTARRPVTEWVFADAARHEPRITIRHGARVTGLTTGAAARAGIPHVTGVRVADGAEFDADLVIDASGRQSRNSEWLQTLGARAPYEEQADCGFMYFTRYFRGVQPQRLAPTLTAIGTISLLTLLGDNGTWSVTVFAAAGDTPLKTLRDVDRWTRVVRACPMHAHWLDGEPMTDILPIAGIVDRYRRYVVDESPVATGFIALADAWACTNPSAGRGLTVGFLHGAELRNALRESADRPAELVENFQVRTDAAVTPWYTAQIAYDRARFAQMAALREGRETPLPRDEFTRTLWSFLQLFIAHPDLFRAGLEYVATITPVQKILERPAVIAGMEAAAQAMKHAPPMPPFGPNRQQLLELLK